MKLSTAIFLQIILLDPISVSAMASLGKKSSNMESIRLFLIFLGGIFSIACGYFVTLSFIGDDVLLQRHNSIITPQTDNLSNNRSKHQHKISWTPYRDESLAAKYNRVSKWGSYRPGFYFGMKTSTPEDGNSMSTGIMWGDTSRKQFRHDTKQGELARFEWNRHDGKNYGRQILSDSAMKLDLTTSFIANHEDSELSWIQKVQLKKRKSEKTVETTSPLLFYFGSDCADDAIRSTCLGKTEMKDIETFDFIDSNNQPGIQLIGHSGSTWFVLTALSSGVESLSFVTLNQVDVYAGSSKLLEECLDNKRSSQSRQKKQKQTPLYNDFGDLRNEMIGGESKTTNFIAIQATYTDSAEVFFMLQEFSFSVADSAKAARHMATNLLQGNSISEYWTKLESLYNELFETRFANYLSNSADPDGPVDDVGKFSLSHSEIDSVKVALSSLLGGLGYFEGMPSIEFAVQSELDLKNFKELQSENLHQLGSTRTKLFTGTPSRTAFPRGFLWDEGFHQMVMSHWDLDITFRVISDWLNSMYVSPIPDLDGELMGWIPREMILGDDSSRRVPAEFIIQRATIANPPTFLLVLESLLDRLKNTCDDNEQICSTPSRDEQNRIIEFLGDMYPRLHYWIQWFRYSQQGELPGSFRWRGRSSNDNKVVPNTLASGLDDYPRSVVPSFEERHVDLLCWMIKGYESMSRIQAAMTANTFTWPRIVEDIIKKTKYDEQALFLKSHLDIHHWSDIRGGYFDFGLVNESATFVQEILFRCSSNDQQSMKDIYVPLPLLESREQFCPETHPRPLYPLGDGKGGYLVREKISAENYSLDFIPRIGYVSIFPFILKSVDPSSPTLGSLLTMMEDPRLLYTPYGLRSIATSDIFYLRQNAAGDAPYWR
jgi:mannosyl-oligosaccharide glucosidase